MIRAGSVRDGSLYNGGMEPEARFGPRVVRPGPGQELRALKIPFGQVYASPYCRAMQFSNFMFGRARPEPGMQLPDPLPMEARQQNTADFEKLLETTMPTPGTNTALVAHSPNIRDVFGFGTSADLPVEGGAAILKPGPEKPTIEARILPDEWAAFAQALAIKS